MKAMSMPILVVVTAIIILVVALVILTIFGGGLGSLRTITEATAQCETLGRSSCNSIGQLPPTWEVRSMQVQNDEGGYDPLSCRELIETNRGISDCTSCGKCGYTTQ